MCYYDQFQYLCRDWKWGNFRQHCQREYRMGETCGQRLINQTIVLPETCKLCQKIEAKIRRVAKHEDDLRRWCQDPTRFRASIAKAMEEIKTIREEMDLLRQEKQARYNMIGNPRR